MIILVGRFDVVLIRRGGRGSGLIACTHVELYVTLVSSKRQTKRFHAVLKTLRMTHSTSDPH